MQMVSASKMKKAQDLALNGEPYSQEMRRILISLLSTATKFSHPLLEINSDAQNNLCLFVTTNKGLCGGLNTNHFREIMRWYRQNPNTDFITIGKRGRMLLASLGANIIADFSDLTETIEFTDAVPIAQLILSEYQKGEYKRVFFSYNQFISTLTQKPVRLQLLPIDVNELKDSLGLLEELTEEETRKFEPKEYLIEPNREQIIDWLLPYFVELQIFHFLLENKASEHSARMVAMKNASENAKEVQNQLRLIYNRMRQQQVTFELADIITASMAV